MPQRFLKPGIRSSKRWDGCTWIVQSFYVRLLTLVDDFGRYEVDDVMLKNEAFPLREDIRAAQVREFLKELEARHLLLSYKVDGKEFLALTQWTERARYNSRYPQPPAGKAKELGCMLNKDNQSCLTDNQSPHHSLTPNASSHTPSPKPKPSEGAPAKLVEPNAPPVLESKRQERPNSVELVVAQLEFVKINEREKVEPGFVPYAAEEVRQAWQWFESGKDAETGEWLLMFGSQRKPVGCWKAAMMERIGHNRNNYAGRHKQTADTRGKVGANELKQKIEVKML
jgi:hypothetical protein